MRPRAFHEFCALATQLAARYGSTQRPGSIVDYADELILRIDEGPIAYGVAPKNSDTFAETGGNGVQFGFLVLEGLTPDQYPVVMTVPMADRRYHVVGENFREFLCLGCKYGYFSLEQLAYSRDETIAEIQSGRHATEGDDPPWDLAILTMVRDRMGLQPWPDVAARLEQLQSRWRNEIQLSGEARGMAGPWDLAKH